MKKRKSMTSTDKEEVEVSFNLKNPEVIICTLSFILIYLSFLENWKECLMREHTKQPYRIFTSLVERHNSSSPMMFRCWLMVVVFHNILSFMTDLKIYIKCYHVHMWEVIWFKGSPIFARKMDCCVSQISWNIFYGFNANYKILTKFGKYDG